MRKRVAQRGEAGAEGGGEQRRRGRRRGRGCAARALPLPAECSHFYAALTCAPGLGPLGATRSLFRAQKRFGPKRHAYPLRLGNPDVTNSVPRKAAEAEST